jgi:two-component system cell cycle sensor histidine kinase PleC
MGMRRLQKIAMRDSLLARYTETLGELMMRRYSEEAMRAGKAESDLANRSKSAFLATMSHELRTPLNAIIGFSDVIQATNSDASAHAEYAEHISKAGRRMLSVVSDILDMSKLEGGTLTLSLQPCSLNDVIDASVDAVQADAEAKSQTLDVRVNGELPLLAIDYKRIKQIMLNLFSNAIKFTPDKGSIVLSAEPSPNGGAILTVTDTGAGMSAEQTATALRPFGQVQSYLSRTQEGAGLGLPIALGLAQIHGGNLHLESEPGVGTRAILTLPPSKRSVS